MTSDEVNQLPEKVRTYIHHLETNADPAGMVRDNIRLEDENRGLMIMINEMKEALV